MISKLSEFCFTEKLIRDRMYDLGDPAEWERKYSFRRIKAGSPEHVQLLKQKLLEEVLEYLEAVPSDSRVEELGDVLSVMKALAKYDVNVGWGNVQDRSCKKDGERGVFDYPIVMTKREDAD